LANGKNFAFDLTIENRIRLLFDYFFNRLTPALEALLNDAKNAGAIRRGVDAAELLLAMTRVATPASEGDIAQARRMVALLVDGLHYGADDLSKNDRF